MKRLLIGLLFLAALISIPTGIFILSKNNFKIDSFLGGPRVKVISAKDFKKDKAKELIQLKEKGLVAWKDQGLYILDIRSREEYAKGHVKGSVSLPAEKAGKDFSGIENVDVAIYSSKSKLKEVQEVVASIKENIKKETQQDKEKFGTIYLIKDGYEGLVEADVETEARIWD